MNGWRLFRWVLWRGIISGAVLGAVLGTVFGTANGITLAILTHICFSPLLDQRHYRWSMLLVSIATTIAISLLWASGIDASLEVTLILTVVASFTTAFLVWCLPHANSTASEAVRRPPANAVLFYIEK